MKFTKMHGIGNDYVYVDCFEETLPMSPEKIAIAVSDRHFGVGGDGLVLILPPTAEGNGEEGADARMRMFNADGSEGEMCGNAIRCVAKYLYEHGICRKEKLEIETATGRKTLQLQILSGKVATIRVDMGAPVLVPARIPTLLRSPKGESEPIVELPFEIEGREITINCVSMGNPHCVVFVRELTDELVLGLGPKIELDGRFPKRINVEFVEVLARDEVRMRVWERGSGETWACGTGACAVVVAAVLAEQMDRNVLVHLRGGDLEIHWSEEDNHLYKTGPATEVFQGEIFF